MFLNGGRWEIPYKCPFCCAPDPNIQQQLEVMFIDSCQEARLNWDHPLPVQASWEGRGLAHLCFHPPPAKLFNR